MKKNYWTLFSLLLICTLVVGARGRSAAQDDTPTLTIWIDALFAPTVEEIGQGFTEEYGVEVVVQSMSMGDVRDQLIIAGPAGEGPDIVEGAHDWLGQLLETGVIAPIDLGDKQDLFAPAAIQAFSDGGQLYALPMITENIGLFRNLDLTPEAPQTWDELVSMCEARDTAEVEYCLLFPQGGAYMFFPIMTSFGGYVFGQNDDGSYNPEDLGIDNDGSLAAAQWLDGMVKAGHTIGVDYDTGERLFIDGQALFVLTGPWQLPAFKEAGVNYAISPIPAGTEPARPFLGVRGFMVSSFSDQAALAETFLTEYMATDKMMQMFYEGSNKATAYLPVLEQIDDSDVTALAEAGQDAVPMPSIPEMAAFWTVMGSAIDLILTQQADPVETFQNAAEQIRTLIEEGQ